MPKQIKIRYKENFKFTKPIFIQTRFNTATKTA